MTLIALCLAAMRITRRERQAMAALDRSEQQFGLLVAGVKDYALYMLDPQGRVMSWNDGAERIKGFRRDEIIGEDFARFYTPEARAAGAPQRALDTALRDGTFETEDWRVRRDGSRFWASVVIDPLHDGLGRLIGFAKITRDITERREIQQALETTRANLAQAQKMEAVGQLTGGIAHDFNNMLHVILGTIETLQRHVRLNEPRFARALDMAQQSAQRAAILTRQLLAFARRQPLQPKPIDPNKLVAGMSDLLRRALRERVALETVLAGGVWPVLVDANQLESAILNLALNARDAMPAGGKLTIETQNAHLDEAYAQRHVDVTAGQYVMIAISDTGSGMTPETMTKAFEPFFTTKANGLGTGLGLSQVYGFVKQSDGHVKLYSETGEGTTVKIYLPRHRIAAALEEPTPDTTAIAEASRAEIILVVEDDEGARSYCVAALGELGYRVLAASDGPSALRLLEAEPAVSLLFTDVGLPGGLNGRQLADMASARHPDLKVLFTTAYARNAIVHEGRLDPGVELLGKPFTFAALAAKVRHMLES
jgi:PAS domain S-box-containing protein